MGNIRYETTRGKIEKEWQLVNANKQALDRLAKQNVYFRSLTYNSSIFKYEFTSDITEYEYPLSETTASYYIHLKNFPERIVQYIRINVIFSAVEDGTIDILKKDVSNINIFSTLDPSIVGFYSVPPYDTFSYSDWVWLHSYWIQGFLLDKEHPTDPDIYDYWIYFTIYPGLIDYDGWYAPYNPPSPGNFKGNIYDIKWKLLATVHIPNNYNEIKVTKK